MSATATTYLVKGQNGPLEVGELVISVEIAAPADLCALLVDERGKVRSDADFVFYNQPTGSGVRLRPAADGQPAVLEVSTAAVPADIAQVRIVTTLDDTTNTFGRIPPPIAAVADPAGQIRYRYRIDGLGSESVVIALELYRRDDGWKVRAVGQGYAGGFAALVTDHGVVVDDEPAPVPVYRHEPEAAQGRPLASTPRPVLTDTPPVRTAPGEEKLSLEKRQKLDLRKREVATVLMKKGASDVRARVVLVIDKTGSMHKLYRKGVVHRVVQRMIPVAIQLDDNGRLEPYLYAVRFAKLPEITVEHADAWCGTFLHLSGVHGGIDYAMIGGVNDEIPIMNEVIAGLSGDGSPTLVLFFTDGGFREKAKIAALMRKAAALPAFWQFVGMGGKADYGILRQLDEMDGRVVDNAGFFTVDDIDGLGDADLYNRLLGEFPDWLRAARAAGIVRTGPVDARSSVTVTPSTTGAGTDG
ncbi:VWA domain-containing protein [Nocardia brevicatena]|uniref:VWA domain-containing protein n=1 Tax=Nocardia brevicatena TaxID=37327 RepID=UPI0003139BBD|nr:VWA domain-containing protein [Nocardia brevicatena]